jgi:DNA polymerase III subunit epsilon
MSPRPASDRTGPREPPPGPPWDLALADAPLCFVDLEMTGLRASEDRVIEICVERVLEGRVVGRVCSLVRPEGGAFGNAHIHGIAPDDVASAPTFAELVARVEEILDGGILVAHAAAWDVAFLEAELHRAARPLRVHHYLDTLALSRRAFAFTSHRLSSLCQELGIARSRAHRAADDVAAMRVVFDRVCAVLSPTTPRDLWHVRVGQRHARPEVLRAAEEALSAARPSLVRYRPAHRAPEALLFQITEVRTDLDPPRVLGYLLPSRSRRELRADRILAIEPIEPIEPAPPARSSGPT